MFERFTDRARKVMALANQEALRFNCEYVGTEHFLLGLIKEGSGVAASVLRNLGVDLRKVRLEVEKLCNIRPDDKGGAGQLPQTPRAKKVIEYAIEEARNFDHNYVGTEHLLLGLLREHEGVAAQVLMNLGLKLESVRAQALDLIGYGKTACGPSTAEYTKAEIRDLMDVYAGAAHLLLGRLRECADTAAQAENAREPSAYDGCTEGLSASVLLAGVRWPTNELRAQVVPVVDALCEERDAAYDELAQARQTLVNTFNRVNALISKLEAAESAELLPKTGPERGPQMEAIIDGKKAHCSCGGSVFTELDPSTWRCNTCFADYDVIRFELRSKDPGDPA